MKSALKIIFSFLGLTAIAQTKTEITEMHILEETNYQRFVLVKGENLKDVKSILAEYFEIFSDDENPAPNISYLKLNDWTILRLEDKINPYNFHNLVYWFLGTPPDDENYADYSIGFSQNDKNNSYIVYNDYDLREKIATNDDLFCVTPNNQKFILSIPFAEIKLSDSDEIYNYNSLLLMYELDKINSNTLIWNKIVL